MELKGSKKSLYIWEFFKTAAALRLLLSDELLCFLVNLKAKLSHGPILFYVTDVKIEMMHSKVSWFMLYSLWIIVAQR